MKATILTLALCAAMLGWQEVACATDIVSAQTGSWNATATWVGGVVPTATDNVEIAAGHTVTIVDANAECNNLTANGFLYFDIVNTGTRLVVNGDAIVGGTGRLRSGSGTPVGIKNHELVLQKNLTVNSGGSFDMRVGSGSNVSVARVVFSGSSSSTISLSLTSYSSSGEEFNSVIINKSGGAKVVLASGNLFQNNNSTTAPDTLVFMSGIVETGMNHWVNLRTSSAAFVGASSASHIKGYVGRGASNSVGTSTVEFPLGDGVNYRPAVVRINTPANATGHYVWGTLHTGNANTGSSILGGGIDLVSAVRYYEVGYLQNAGTATTMPIFRLSAAYGSGDGVVEGNTDLRVAYSTNARGTWTGQGPSDHATTITDPPTIINSDSLTTNIPLATGTSMFLTLANATGGPNPLPVQLASFTGRYVSQSSVRLTWRTISEVNNYGFMVERRNAGESIWIEVASSFVAGYGTTSQPQNYTFTDETAGGVTIEYRLRQIDMDGSVNYSEPIIVSSPTSVAERVPERFELQQNYPNPFNPGTTINFSVGKDGRAVLDVFTVLGEKVATMYDGIAEAGTMYTARFDGSSLASGVYLYRLTSNNSVQIKRMHLMK